MVITWRQKYSNLAHFDEQILSFGSNYEPEKCHRLQHLLGYFIACNFCNNSAAVFAVWNLFSLTLWVGQQLIHNAKITQAETLTQTHMSVGIVTAVVVSRKSMKRLVHKGTCLGKYIYNA